MRHQSIVEFSSIEAESFKALKLEPGENSDDELRRVRGPSLPKTCCSASSEHHVAWGEDLVLALRPGEIIPSGRLRDHGDWHWAGRELSHGEGHRDLGAGIGPGDIIIRCTH
ncbi:hypothetical protein FF2_005856 [Malus domestica]